MLISNYAMKTIETTYKDLFDTEEDYNRYIKRLEKKISTFDVSYMSNAKWCKLFTAIVSHKDLIKQCEIYDFFGFCVNEIAWHKIADDNTLYIHEDYISEKITTGEHPTYYREIEYIEFKARWQGAYIGELLPPNYETQDLNAIEEMLNSLGKFQIIKTDESLKIMGYQ